MDNYLNLDELGGPYQSLTSGLDGGHTLNPSALTYTKHISSEHDLFKDGENGSTRLLLGEYQEDSLSDSSSSKRASSEASSKSSATAGDLIVDGLDGDVRMGNAPKRDELSSSPPMFHHRNAPFGKDPFGEDDFINESFDFGRASSSPGAEDGMDIGGSSPETDLPERSIPSNSKNRNGTSRRSDGFVKNESVSSFPARFFQHHHEETLLA